MVVYATTLLTSFNNGRKQSDSIQPPMRLWIPKSLSSTKALPIPFSKRILATSAATLRKYGSDYQELNIYNTIISVALVVVRAAMPLGQSFSTEYAEFNENNNSLHENGLPEIPFDWVEATSRYEKFFWQGLRRLGPIEIIKKIYEFMLTFESLVSPLLFDGLTKQPLKSLERRCDKGFSRGVLATKMFITTAWSTLTYHTATLTFDAISDLYQHCSREPTNPPSPPVDIRARVLYILVWTGRKVSIVAAQILCSSLSLSLVVYAFPRSGLEVQFAASILDAILAAGILEVTTHESTHNNIQRFLANLGLR